MLPELMLLSLLLQLLLLQLFSLLFMLLLLQHEQQVGEEQLQTLLPLRMHTLKKKTDTSRSSYHEWIRHSRGAKHLPTSKRAVQTRNASHLPFSFELWQKRRNSPGNKYYLLPLTTVSLRLFSSSTQMQLCLRLHTLSRSRQVTISDGGGDV